MIYTNLHHIDIEGYYQFVTFRTADSVDNYLLKVLSQDIPNSKKQLEADEYLDNSLTGAYLNGEILNTLSQFLKSKDTVLYELYAFAIMSNHVHLLIKPLVDMNKLMKSLKGTSAKLINELMKRSGQFWAKDYYDKLVRDEEHFRVVYEYIKKNPLKLSAKNLNTEGRFYGRFE